MENQLTIRLLEGGTWILRYGPGESLFNRLVLTSLPCMLEGTRRSILRVNFRNWKAMVGPAIRLLCCAENLKCLDLSFVEVTTADVRTVSSRLGHLSELCLKGTTIKNHSLAHIGRLRNLRVLNLAGCKDLTDSALHQLVELRELRLLDLSECDRLSDSTASALAALPALADLRLSGCQAMRKVSTFKQLFQLPKLTSIDVSYCRITDAAVMHLPQRLERLNLSNCPRLTEASAQFLTQTLVNLQCLGLRGPTLTLSLKNLSNLKGIQQLDLSGCAAVSDDTISCLRLLVDLRDLRLRGCGNVSNEGVKILCQISMLISLDLSCCGQITDAGAFMLSKGNPHLQSLDLSFNHHITVVGARALARKPGLIHLNLDYCGFSDTEWRTLRISRWASNDFFILPSPPR
jgi:F-box/leucine-rich repeat protein 14